MREATQALYRSPEWRRRQKQQLAREPWCRFHLRTGQFIKATIADHIDRHGGDPVRFRTIPLQSLCKRCHDSVKQAIERGSRLGVDESTGMPTDPRHPWAQGPALPSPGQTDPPLAANRTAGRKWPKAGG